MPVLAQETSVYPADLFAEVPTFPPLEGTWWVIHARPRTEKVLARSLAQLATPFYLPLYERSYRLQRRQVRSFVPLFPGYVFVRADEEARRGVQRMPQVASVIHVADQPRLEADLRQVFSLIESKAPLAPEERLEPGMPAEIVHGAFRGFRGTMVRRGGNCRFVIEVNFLQRGASIEIDSSDIRPLA